MVVVMRVDADSFAVYALVFFFFLMLPAAKYCSGPNGALAGEHVQFSSVIRNTCSSDGPPSIAAKPYFCLSLLYSKQDDGLFPY